MSSLDDISPGTKQNVAGREFEERVYLVLCKSFRQVQRNQRLEGSSGVRWNVDFIVDGSLLVEASTQKSTETKINSTFMKFADIIRKEPQLKCVLLFERFHVRQRRRSHRKVFPTSAYRTMLAFGFAILTIDDVSKLVHFKSGTLDSKETSSFPTDFVSRSLEYDRQRIGRKVLQILSKEPVTYGGLVKAIGKERRVLVDTIGQLPQVIRVGNNYGLSEDQIYRWLITKRVISSRLRRKVLEWKAQLFLRAVTSQGSYKTVQFAAELGVSRNAVKAAIHLLKQRGLIRKVGSGTWESVGDTRRSSPIAHETPP